MTGEQKVEAALPPTAYAVLGTLAFGRELSGYDIKKWADASLQFFYWSPALSHIYRELTRLAERGLIEPTGTEPASRNRRAYRITPAGRAALAEWAGETEAEATMLKHPVALRMWLGHTVSTDALCRLLRRHVIAVEHLLADLDASIAHAADDPQMTYPEAALRWARTVHTADLEGARTLLRELSGLSPAG